MSTGVIQANVTQTRTVRRPSDLVRLVIAALVIAILLGVAVLATRTTAGLDADLERASERLPNFFTLLFAVISGTSALVLPLLAVVVLLARREGREILQALVGGAAATVAVFGASVLVATADQPRLTKSLTGSVEFDEQFLFSPVLAALVAFITVSRFSERSPWQWVSGIAIGITAFANVVAGGTTTVTQVISILIGYATGLLFRYAFGITSTEPNESQLIDALSQAGVEVSSIERVSSALGGARYLASGNSGRVGLLVLNRDLEGAGLFSTAWRTLRLQDGVATTSLGMRKRIENLALVSLAARQAGVRVPEVLATLDINQTSLVCATKWLAGKSLAEAGALSDEDLGQVIRAVQKLHDSDIAHRALSADHIIKNDEGQIVLVGLEYGTIAASPLAVRLDNAELLVTLALLSDPARVVRVAKGVLTRDELLATIGVMQVLAMSRGTREAARGRKEVVTQLRSAIAATAPSIEVQEVNLQRIKPRTAIMVALSVVAAYVVLPQLVALNLAEIFRQASIPWVLVALAASFISYPAAALTLKAFVIQKLSWFKTLLAQFATTFAALLSPPTLGTVAINGRFLQRAGLSVPVAGATIATSQLVALLVHIALMIAVGVAAGTSQNFSFNPSEEVVFVVLVVAILFVGVVSLPPVRRRIVARAKPVVSQIGPQLALLGEQPWRFAWGVVGAVGLNAARSMALIAAVLAFGGDASWLAIVFVYLAGATIGQAAPTPGGIGAVEAALAAGLIAVGLDSTTAISTALLYRIATFWLPILPGWASFWWLQRKHAL
jgi:uncharacterized membrane protein YbhN (UPF0104 family)